MEFERRIDEFADAPLCYFGLNSFHVAEESILRKIHREFDLLLVTWPEEFLRQSERLIQFLGRSADNRLITIRYNLQQLRIQAPETYARLYPYREKILLLEDLLPAEAFDVRLHVNSATMMLCSLIYCGHASNIFITGMDAKPDNAAYFKQAELNYRPLTQDFRTDVFCFTQNWKLLLENMRKEGRTRIPPILNCNLESGVDIFPKISYDLFSYLTGSPVLPPREAPLTLAKADPIGPCGRMGVYPFPETLGQLLNQLGRETAELAVW